MRAGVNGAPRVPVEKPAGRSTSKSPSGHAARRRPTPPPPAEASGTLDAAAEVGIFRRPYGARSSQICTGRPHPELRAFEPIGGFGPTLYSQAGHPGARVQPRRADSRSAGSTRGNPVAATPLAVKPPPVSASLATRPVLRSARPTRRSGRATTPPRAAAGADVRTREGPEGSLSARPLARLCGFSAGSPADKRPQLVRAPRETS